MCYQFGDGPPSTPWRARSRSPGRRCSGCATSSASSAAPPRSRRWPARSTDNGGVYFVPAFSGLFAPYWRSDARGAIVGLSRFHTSAHLARATLEAICYQTRDVVEAMEQDSGVHLEVLKVDGGVTANDLCMQLQADILGVAVVRPVVAETTALGAAYAAGLAIGFWKDPDELRAELAGGPALDAVAGPRTSATPATPAGRRRSSAPWTGWTSREPRPGRRTGSTAPGPRPTCLRTPAPTPGAPAMTAAPTQSRRPRARAGRHGRARSSTSSSSAAASPAPAAPWTR